MRKRQAWVWSGRFDFLAAVAFVSEEDVASASPDVCANGGKCHCWWQKLCIVSMTNLRLTFNITKKQSLTTYLTITPQLQILFRFHPLRHLTLRLSLQLLLCGLGLDPLSNVTQNFTGAQHAICIEAIVAEFRISGGDLFEGQRKGEVPVG
jgi:hypothetical protein